MIRVLMRTSPCVVCRCTVAVSDVEQPNYLGEFDYTAECVRCGNRLPGPTTWAHSSSGPRPTPRFVDAGTAARLAELAAKDALETLATLNVPRSERARARANLHADYARLHKRAHFFRWLAGRAS